MNSMQKLTYEQIFQVCMTTLLSTHFTHTTYILCITVHALHDLHKLHALQTLHYIHYIIWHNITLHIIHTSDSDNYMHLIISSIWYMYIYIELIERNKKGTYVYHIIYSTLVLRVYLYASVYKYVSIYTNVHACMHACVHACMQKMQYMCACVSTCRCIYLYLFISKCISICIFIFISYLYSEIYVLLTELQSSFTNPQTWIKMVCREFPCINIATDFWRQCHLMSLAQIRITTIEDSQPTRPLPVVWFVWCESLWGSKRLRGDSPSHHHI